MSTATTSVRGTERFTPSARDVILMAQREAIRMNAASVDPEHLLLGIIVQGDERALNVLGRLGMDVESARARLGDVASTQKQEQWAEVADLPLSREAQECIRWALSFTSHMHASALFPDHLLLGVLRHQRVQPLLAFLFPSIEALYSRISEEIGPAYTAYMDQLIHSRVRDASVVSYKRGIAQRVLRRFERPAATFIDVVDLDEAKQALRDVVEFLKATPMFQLSGGRFPHGILLVGSTGNERRLLIQAAAGEAVVPLITLSMQALVEALVDLNAGVLHLDDLELPAREYTLFKRGTFAENGQRYIQYLFQEAKEVSPSILSIEDIDALARLGKDEGRELLLRQLLAEMDALDKHYRTVVIASTGHAGDLDQALLRVGRFERRIVLALDPVQPGSKQTSFCPACRRAAQADWQYCAYCGAELAKACAQCGTPRPQVEGVRFCPGCGAVLT